MGEPERLTRTVAPASAASALGGRLADAAIGRIVDVGFAFPLVIALITARTRSHAVTARLSGFVQPVGYLLAGIGPFAVGLLHELTGGNPFFLEESLRAMSDAVGR